uniref:(northern house mosquito) hypothetical protein n=1 Tax=Culex pipiens TaxID=7175 RepID=A0A8D8L5H2_CULPI
MEMYPLRTQTQGSLNSQSHSSDAGGNRRTSLHGVRPRTSGKLRTGVQKVPQRPPPPPLHQHLNPTQPDRAVRENPGLHDARAARHSARKKDRAVQRHPPSDRRVRAGKVAITCDAAVRAARANRGAGTV